MLQLIEVFGELLGSMGLVPDRRHEEIDILVLRDQPARRQRRTPRPPRVTEFGVCSRLIRVADSAPTGGSACISGVGYVLRPSGEQPGFGHRAARVSGASASLS
jgi:hypothetical protein